MNTSLSDLLPRHIEPLLKEALVSARVVNLVGPRQSGKTTLVRDLLAEGRFVTLDDDTKRMSIELDPVGQLNALRKSAHDHWNKDVANGLERGLINYRCLSLFGARLTPF